MSKAYVSPSWQFYLHHNSPGESQGREHKENKKTENSDLLQWKMVDVNSIEDSSNDLDYI